jgi:hypothetical protein
LIDLLTKATKARPVTVDFDDLAGKAKESSGQVKACVSSRHYPILVLDTVPPVSVKKDISGDLAQYISECVQQIESGMGR